MKIDNYDLKDIYIVFIYGIIYSYIK
jgi:hypothetical protein